MERNLFQFLSTFHPHTAAHRFTRMSAETFEGRGGKFDVESVDPGWDHFRSVSPGPHHLRNGGQREGENGRDAGSVNRWECAGDNPSHGIPVRRDPGRIEPGGRGLGHGARVEESGRRWITTSELAPGRSRPSDGLLIT